MRLQIKVDCSTGDWSWLICLRVTAVSNWGADTRRRRDGMGLLWAIKASAGRLLFWHAIHSTGQHRLLIRAEGADSSLQPLRRTSFIDQATGTTIVSCCGTEGKHLAGEKKKANKFGTLEPNRTQAAGLSRCCCCCCNSPQNEEVADAEGKLQDKRPANVQNPMTFQAARAIAKLECHSNYHVAYFPFD